jgi:hypothetical protein
MLKDMVGQTSGMLTVIERAGVNKGGDAMWRCLCRCGETRVRGGELRRGQTKSCGKHAATPPVKDMTGQRFGRWTVVERNGSKRGKAAWRVQCDCGKEATHAGHDLRRGQTKSCGCGTRQGATARHGHARKGAVSPTYVTWQATIKRCEYPGRWNFKYWGGKGITVCERWRFGDGTRSGFECFLADMGPKPFGLSLDRIDCDGNYEPRNVRWTTRIGQARNRAIRPAPLTLAA